MNFNGIFGAAKGFLTRHGSSILTGLGVAGIFGAVALAIVETPKALDELEEAKKTVKKSDWDTVKTAKTVWKCYIPAASVALTSAACVITAHVIDKRQLAAASAAALMTKMAFQEYRDSAKEVLSEEQLQYIDRKADAKRSKRRKLGQKETPRGDVVILDSDCLCVEPISGREFKSTPQKLRCSINDANDILVDEGSVTINEFYDCLGLGHTATGDQDCWRLEDGMIKVRFSAKLNSDDYPVIVLKYERLPTRD